MRQQIPELVLYYDWATDHLGHEDGPDGPKVRGSLVRADTHFGNIVNAYKRAGIYEDTYFLLLSDHSQMPLNPHYVRIDQIFAEKGFKIDFVSHELIAKSGLSGLLRIGSILRGRGKITGHNAIIGTAGGGLVMLYLSRDGGTDAESWREEVYHKDLKRYPVAPDHYINVEDLINSIEGVDFFFVRENKRIVGEPHITRIVSRHGSSRVSARFNKGSPVKLKYEVIEGADPLGYSGKSILVEMIASGYHDDREWLRATAATDYPDAVLQIAQIMELDRSGSVIILPDDRHSFNSRIWSKHGGLSADEMHTTFAISGPGLRPGVIQHSRVVDVLPSLLNLMGKEVPSGRLDGIVLPELAR
jgi:hypothetical protein